MKVSIITVCFNSAKTIAQTIESVIGQTYQNVEYIIIDGGSSDGTLDIIQQYESHLSQWGSEPDRGIYDAMNKGIAKATGDIIGIINSDDWCDTQAIERVVACFLEQKVDIVHGKMTYVTQHDRVQCMHGTGSLDDRIFKGMICHHPTVFVKKELYEKYGAFDTVYRIAADYDLMLRFYGRQCSMAYLPYNLAYFRLGGFSAQKMWRCRIETKQAAWRHLNLCSADIVQAMESRMKCHFAEIRKDVRRKYLVQRAARRTSKEQGKKILRCLLGAKESVAIFGAGLDGLYCFQWFTNFHVPVYCFMDNAPEKQAQKMGGLPIHCPESVKHDREKMMIVIAAGNYQNRIEEQLLCIGMQKSMDYVYLSDLQDAFVRMVYEK